MRAGPDFSDFVNRGQIRVTRSMLGGDPQIGSEQREAERLHRGGSGSYVHASDLVPHELPTTRNDSYLDPGSRRAPYGKTDVDAPLSSGPPSALYRTSSRNGGRGWSQYE